MDRDMQHLISKSLRSRRNLDAHRDRHRYTSLRDVMLRHRLHPAFRSSRRHALWMWVPAAAQQYYHGGAPLREFDASAIGIRNHLVKHAASAYLQTANVAAASAEGQDCITQMWWRLRQRRPSWRGCMGDPFEQCIGFVARSVSRVLTCVVGHLGMVCALDRRTSMA